jgi:glycosyltransferase involved in cell wall biosynthesis
MKILYLADAGSIHTQRWVNYFAEKGNSVHLISASKGKGYLAGVQLHYLPRLTTQIWTLSKYPSGLLWMLQARRLINKIKPDILHVHYINIPAFSAALSGSHPLVLSAWGSDVLAAPKNSKFVRFMVKFALERADVITTTAEFMGDYLANYFGLEKSKIVRIPWGIDLRVFHRGYEEEAKRLRASLNIDETAPVITSNRSMAPQYEIQSITDAIPFVLHKHSNAIFVFLRGSGTEEYENQIKSKAKELGVLDNIRFVSKLIEPEEMAIYLNMSYAAISIPKYGQFGASILEGMVCGAIPIASNISVHQTLLEDGRNAFLADPTNPKDIAEKIIFSLQRPELKEAFYQINKVIVEEKEDWDKNANKMQELYEKLVSVKS